MNPSLYSKKECDVHCVCITFIIFLVFLYSGAFLLSFLVPLLFDLFLVNIAIQFGCSFHESGAAPVIGYARPDGCRIREEMLDKLVSSNMISQSMQKNHQLFYS